ncbi:MAG: beta-lactamase family protein [Rhizobiales bacterium]|nr:beta-lactamase family protein [Hyphomicrobiales bacterium]
MHTPQPFRNAARLDAVIDRAIGDNRIVGGVFLVAGDDFAYARAAGFADREARIPMREDTIFRLSSITKPMVAATALAMIERGKLALDDKVSRFLPAFRPKAPDGSVPEISIHQLLTHTSGLGYPTMGADDPYVKAEISTGIEGHGRTEDDNLKRLAGVPLFAKPGTEWRYGMSLDVLGAILGIVQGSTLGDAVAHYVTRPLDMTDTAFTLNNYARLAIPYRDNEGGATRMNGVEIVSPEGRPTFMFDPARVFDNRSYQSGGAGMVGTATDFLRFLEAIRKGGAPILKRETVEMAVANQIGTLVREDSPGWRFSYLGAWLEDRGVAKVPFADGALRWGGVWGHNWSMDRKAGITIVGFTNTALEGCNGPFIDEVRDAVYA